jgi:uncharacterized protein with GYD domain
MATFMVQFKYTEKGMQGLVKDGGTKRREATRDLVEALGGKLVAYYFGFGEYDGLAIIEGLDNAETVAGNLTAAVTGTVQTKTTVLVTPEEMDQATKKMVPFRAPGE